MVGTKEDLKIWLLFLDHFNGSAIFPVQAWFDESDLNFFTNASAGICFGGFLMANGFRVDAWWQVQNSCFIS